MPVTLELPPDDAIISLDEFVGEIAKRHLKLDEYAGLLEAARWLKRLNNNKSFVIDEIVKDVAAGNSFQRANIYGPQVFILHVSGDYFLRANIWQPISPVESNIPGFRYDICHDHNFDILTAGYFGPGYVSRTYEYEYADVAGVLGENAALETKGDFQLREGALAIYRAKRDIHIQLPPPSLSVSLNLIPKGRVLREPQFQFDEQNGRICRYLQSSGAELAIRLCGVLGDKRHSGALSNVLDSDAGTHVKALAAVALCQLTGEIHLPANASVRARYIVESELDCYGTCLSLKSSPAAQANQLDCDSSGARG